MFRTLFPGFLCLLLAVACNVPEPKEPEVITETSVTQEPTAGYRFEIFLNVDSVGEQHGYGYDIYAGDKKLIHQTNIPGEPGVDGFISEAEATTIAEVVIEKLNAGGGFPTLSHDELVDYGITLKQ